MIAAQVLLTTIDYTEYGEIARNNFHILEDLPHTEEIDSTEDDEERDPERLVSQLIWDSHDSRDWEWDDDLDDIVELWLDREGGGAVLRIGDIVQEDIGIDLISPPEPSDHEWEKYPEYPRIRDISYCRIVEWEYEDLSEDEHAKWEVFLDRLDRAADDPPDESWSAHHETDEYEWIAELDEVGWSVDTVCEEKSCNDWWEYRIREKSCLLEFSDDRK